MVEPRILVLCTGNRCRSQMAEGWIRHHLGGRGRVASAGTNPKGVHPLTVAVMEEAGIDLADHTSDHLSRYLDDTWDVVVTVCDAAREACPVFPGAATRVHRSFPDPDDPTLADDQALTLFRAVRDEIALWSGGFVAGFLAGRS